jgi:hypothetical protein
MVYLLIRGIIFLSHQHATRPPTYNHHTFDILHDSLSHPNNNEPHHLGSPTMPTLPDLDPLFQRNERFEWLISAQESEIGEAPSAYCRVVPRACPSILDPIQGMDSLYCQR